MTLVKAMAVRERGMTLRRRRLDSRCLAADADLRHKVTEPRRNAELHIQQAGNEAPMANIVAVPRFIWPVRPV